MSAKLWLTEKGHV